MAKRQREWARKTRDKLFDQLGRKCSCGATTNLEFDIKIPTGDVDKDGKEKHHRAMDWSWRMSFYRKQYDLGNLQVLCGKCNLRKLNSMELLKQEPPIMPF